MVNHAPGTESVRGVLSLFRSDWSQGCTGAHFGFQESRGQLCVWSKEHLVESCVPLRSDCGDTDGLTSASVRMQRKSAPHPRFVKNAASWFRLVSQVPVQEKLQVHPCQVACASLHRAGSRLECSSSDEDVMSLGRRQSRGLPGSFDATSGSIGMEIDGVRWFLSRGKHDTYRCTFPSCLLFDLLRMAIHRDAS